MAVELTEADLHAAISKAELDALAKRAIEVAPESQPIDEAIADGLSEIELYCDPRLVPDAILKRIWRTLAISAVFNRLSTLPEKRKEELTYVRKLLTEIRDGKFPGLLPDPEKTVIEETTDGAESPGGLYGSSEAAATFRLP